jgi:hypothetical protein
MTTAPATATSALPHATPAAPHDPDLGRLLIRCQDQPGIVSAVSSFLTQAGANIVALDQHSTIAEGGAFFQRTEFHLPGLPAARDELARSFAGLAQHFDMDFQFSACGSPARHRPARVPPRARVRALVPDSPPFAIQSAATRDDSFRAISRPIPALRSIAARNAMVCSPVVTPRPSSAGTS